MTNMTSIQRAATFAAATLALLAMLTPAAAHAQANTLPAPIASAIRASEAARADYAFNLHYQTADGEMTTRFSPGRRRRCV